MKRVICLLLISLLLWTLSLAVSSSSGTVYESEPNDEFEDADRTYNDYDSYGAISQSDYNGLGDTWKITFPYSGYANFYLGHIPSGCNYELVIYKPDLSGILAYSYNTGNKRELVTAYVQANQTYYICVFSISGYSSSNYLLRAKVYPTKTISMPLYEQYPDTCSTESGRMVLASYGVYVNHTTFHDKQEEYSRTEWNSAPIVAKTINYFLTQNGISVTYKSKPVYSLDNDEYNNVIIHNIVANHPVIPLIKFTDTNYFPIPSKGHFVALKGTTFNPNNRVFSAIINDPWNGYAATRTLPTADLYRYNLSHPAPHMVCVND